MSQNPNGTSQTYNIVSGTWNVNGQPITSRNQAINKSPQPGMSTTTTISTGTGGLITPLTFNSSNTGTWVTPTGVPVTFDIGFGLDIRDCIKDLNKIIRKKYYYNNEHDGFYEKTEGKLYFQRMTSKCVYDKYIDAYSYTHKTKDIVRKLDLYLLQTLKETLDKYDITEIKFRNYCSETKYKREDNNSKWV